MLTKTAYLPELAGDSETQMLRRMELAREACTLALRTVHCMLAIMAVRTIDASTSAAMQTAMRRAPATSWIPLLATERTTASPVDVEAAAVRYV
jgi:hypothetical protein